MSSNGQGVNVEDLSREDLVRIVVRDQSVKQELSARVGRLTSENVELYVVINELQTALNVAQQAAAPQQPLDFNQST